MTFILILLKALSVDLISTKSIVISAHYSPGCILEKDVNAFLDHFESALSYIVDHPKHQVCDVQLINDSEMLQVIQLQRTDLGPHTNMDVFDSLSHPGSVGNISELIELQVERTPQKIAVSFTNVTGLVIFTIL